MRVFFPLLTIAALFLLSSWRTNEVEIITLTAKYVGFVPERDEGKDVYIFETNDNAFLEFYSVDKSVLDTYTLNTKQFNGKIFTIVFSNNFDTGEMTLKKLILLSK